MKPILYALNAGRGDAFFLEIENGASRAVVLIDGGEKFWHERATSGGFAEAMGWKRIHLLILTHLHPDHIVGLLPVAENVQVASAVLPYPPLRLSLSPMRHPKADLAADVFRMYGRLWKLLKSQKTAISLRPPFGDAVWRFGEMRLRHVDPTDEAHLTAYGRMKALAADDGMPAREGERLLREFFALSNEDSSVWVVEHGEHGEQLMLFGGDAPLANWARILDREPLKLRAFKASHTESRMRWTRPFWRVCPRSGRSSRATPGNTPGTGTNGTGFPGCGQRVFCHGRLGMIGINVGVPAPMAFFPFSGYKKSFYGDLHANGRDGVEYYTRKKMVVARY